MHWFRLPTHCLLLVLPVSAAQFQDGNTISAEQAKTIRTRAVEAYVAATTELWAAVQREGAKEGYKVPLASLKITSGPGDLSAYSDDRRVIIGQDLILDLLRIGQASTYIFQPAFASTRSRETALGEYLRVLAKTAMTAQETGKASDPPEVGAFFSLTPEQIRSFIGNMQYMQRADYLFQLMMTSVLAHEYGHLARRDFRRPKATSDSNEDVTRELAADQIGWKITSHLYQNSSTGASLVLLFGFTYRDETHVPFLNLCRRSFTAMARDNTGLSAEVLSTPDGQEALKEMGLTADQYRDILTKKGLFDVSVCNRLQTAGHP